MIPKKIQFTFLLYPNCLSIITLFPTANPPKILRNLSYVNCYLSEAASHDLCIRAGSNFGDDLSEVAGLVIISHINITHVRPGIITDDEMSTALISHRDNIRDGPGAPEAELLLFTLKSLIVFVSVALLLLSS